MPYVVMDECVDILDLTCISNCPVDCIYQGGRKVYIQPDECIDCGACTEVCPVNAISYSDEVPEEKGWNITDNRAFFEDVLPGRDTPLGEPGGAGIIGQIDADTERIRQLPPR